MQLLYEKSVDNVPAQEVLATIAFADIPLRLVPRRENKPEAVEQGRYYPDPVGFQLILEDEDGVNCGLVENNAILRYVARLDERDAHHLYGRTPVEASQVDMWIDFAATRIDRANPLPPTSPEQRRGSARTETGEETCTELEKVFSALEEVLTIRTFLVGERMTLADIAVAFSVHSTYRGNRKYGSQLSRQFKAVHRHYNTVMRHPKIFEVMKKEGVALSQ